MKRLLACLLVFFVASTLFYASVNIVQASELDNTLVVIVAAHSDDIEITISGSLYKNEIGKHPMLWVVVTDGGADYDEYVYESNSSQGWIAQDGQININWEAPDGSNFTRHFYSADMAKKRCGGSFEGLNWIAAAASHNSTFGVEYDCQTRVNDLVDADVEIIQMGYVMQSDPSKRLAYPDGSLSQAATAFRDSITANLAAEINKTVVSNGYQKSLLKIYSHATEEVCVNANEHKDHLIIGNAVRQAIDSLHRTYGFAQIDANWFVVYEPIKPKGGYTRVDENITQQLTQKSELAKMCWETETVYLRHVNYTWTDYPTDPGAYEYSIAQSYYAGGPTAAPSSSPQPSPSPPSVVDQLVSFFKDLFQRYPLEIAVGLVVIAVVIIIAAAARKKKL